MVQKHENEGRCSEPLIFPQKKKKWIKKPTGSEVKIGKQRVQVDYQNE